MTITRLGIILSIGIVVLDVAFNDGRFIDALRDQATQFGYWLNDALSGITGKIAPFH